MASQARHKMDAPSYGIASRIVVPARSSRGERVVSGFCGWSADPCRADLSRRIPQCGRRRKLPPVLRSQAKDGSEGWSSPAFGVCLERAVPEAGVPIEPSSRSMKGAVATGWAWGKSATCCRRPAGRTDFAFKDGPSGRMPEARSDEVERAESEFGAPIVPSPNTLTCLRRGYDKAGAWTPNEARMRNWSDGVPGC